MRVWTMKEAMIKLTGEGLAAFERTECVPGEVLHMYSKRTVCDEAAVSGARRIFIGDSWYGRGSMS